MDELRLFLEMDSRVILDLPNDYKRAAVLIPLIKRNNKWFLLFTRRTSQVTHHKGEISFPGGRIDEDLDENLIQTALRETEEELGIKHVQIIGQIDDIFTISRYVVTPIVGVIEENQEINNDLISTPEIDYILEVPVADLALPEIFSLKEVTYKDGIIFSVPFFDYNGEIIWGATGRILVNFFQNLNQLNPECRLKIMNQDLWIDSLN
jgi:8-oxo-dGTP pyrophosphatase MutT (NUDIX family)